MSEHPTEPPRQHKIISFICYNTIRSGTSSLIRMLHLGKEGIIGRKSTIKSLPPEYSLQTNNFIMKTMNYENDIITTLDTPLYLQSLLVKTIWMSNICVLVIDVSDFDEEKLEKFYETKVKFVENIGPKHLIVCLTKCDLILESDLNSKLDEIRLKLMRVLNGWENVQFIPVSGYTGDNIYTPDYEYSKGETLNSILSSIKIDPPKKEWIEKPFVMQIYTTYNVAGIGLVICGRVLSGKIETGHQVFYQEDESNELVSIEINHVVKNRAVAGDGCGIHFGMEYSNNLFDDIKEYGIIHDQSFLETKKVISSFRAQIKIYNSPSKYGIKVGSTFKLYYSICMHCSCKIEEIIYKIDSQTNEKVESRPIILKEGDVAEVILKPQISTPNRRFYLDTFENNEIIGKFILARGVIVASGKVLSVN